MAEIQKVSYTHEAMADYIIANPRASQGELAKAIGYTQAWVSQILSSDSFRAFFAKRKGDLVDPIIIASVDDLMNGVQRQALDMVAQQLEADSKVAGKTALAVKMLEIGQRAAGYGARQASVQVNNYVALIPQKSASALDWLQETGRAPIEPITVDMEHG